ncbi:hypothetical protein PG990_012167 [Apiospora arundinis]
MDGLAVAAAVIQFIEFTSGLIAKGIAIHDSATGLAVDHNELETITSSLTQSSGEIQQSLQNARGQRRLTKNEKDLERIATDCQVVSNELLDVLAGLASTGRRTKWRSFRHALRSTWNEGKVQSLEQRIDRFRQQMMANVLASLRQESKKSICEQASMRESIERIEQIQSNSIPIGDRFVRQIMDGEQWRRDLIQMIHQQGHGEMQKLANLTDDRGLTPNAVVAQKKRIRECVLQKLVFRNMHDRERRISKAHRRTFDFKDFLEGPSKKIYWITGKPGSGKSTLMKYIRQNPLTENLLNTWAGARELVQAAFYFWNSGSHMQMSVDGLLQTVLHDCLRQTPGLVQEVLPERWEAATLFEVDDYPWTMEEVGQALRRLIMEVCPEKRFFVMIDGLDECSGDQAQLIELITELTEDTENLKLCVASRPWNNFEDAFKGRPSLMLQNLSAADIDSYIISKFSANEGFSEFKVRDPTGANKLLESISKKAEGVFLWVHLVVQSLLEGLTNGDGLRDLQQRLEELPPNLEDLYTSILENLDEKYLDHASRLFQIVRACDDSPTLLRIALADQEDGDRAMQAPVKRLSDKDKYALCKYMKRKLISRCRGLLDISSSIAQPIYDVQVNGYQDDSEPDEGLRGVDIADLEVQYLHRSVRDYIQSSEMWSWLIWANHEPFDPHSLLLKSHLLHLKGLHPTSLSARAMGFHIWMAIKYAKRSLSIHSKKKNEQAKEVVHLLDELDRTATILTASTVGNNRSTFVDRQGNLRDEHWSSFFLLRVPDPSFMHVLAICGVHQYLEMRLRRLDLGKEVEYDSSHGKTPLIIAALEGGDCHDLYHGRSAWDLAKNSGHAEMLELFEEYRGKPALRPASQRHETSSNRRGHEDDSDKQSNASTEAVAGGLKPSPSSRKEKNPDVHSHPPSQRQNSPEPPRNTNHRSGYDSSRSAVVYPPPFPQSRARFHAFSYPSSRGAPRPYYEDDEEDGYYYQEHPSYYNYSLYTPPPRSPYGYLRGDRPSPHIFNVALRPAYPINRRYIPSYQQDRQRYASYGSEWQRRPPPLTTRTRYAGAYNSYTY